MNPPEHTADRLTDADGTRAYNAALNYWNDTPASRRHEPDSITLETVQRVTAHSIGCTWLDLRDSELSALADLVEAARTADNFYGERI